MNNEIDEYTKGQNDMLALIKDAYYKADKSEFELLLDKEDENEVQKFLEREYIKKGMKIGRTTLSAEIRVLFMKYGIKI